MTIFIVLLIVILFRDIKVFGNDEFNSQYIGKTDTAAIKGAFVVLVFLGHISTYINLGAEFDKPYVELKSHLSQMVVSMFFFYSGFGMMTSIMDKGFDYVKRIPIKRLLIVFLNFVIAICLYLVVDWFLGETFPVSYVMKSFIGLTSVGNSNWYMFTIFIIYIMMFVAYFATAKFKNKLSLIIMTALFTAMVVFLVLFEIRKGFDTWWYNTVFLVPFGCWFALFKDTIERLLFKRNALYFLYGTIVLICYFLSYRYRWEGIEVYTLWAMCFTMAVVLITMKVRFGSKGLHWLGDNLFGMYILQRIPMFIFKRVGFAEFDKYLYVVLCFVFTISITYIFNIVFHYIDTKVLGLLGQNEKRN